MGQNRKFRNSSQYHSLSVYIITVAFHINEKTIAYLTSGTKTLGYSEENNSLLKMEM